MKVESAMLYSLGSEKDRSRHWARQGLASDGSARQPKARFFSTLMLNTLPTDLGQFQLPARLGQPWLCSAWHGVAMLGSACLGAALTLLADLGQFRFFLGRARSGSARACLPRPGRARRAAARHAEARPVEARRSIAGQGEVFHGDATNKER
jgi:hypothetical protein